MFLQITLQIPWVQQAKSKLFLQILWKFFNFLSVQNEKVGLHHHLMANKIIINFN